MRLSTLLLGLLVLALSGCLSEINKPITPNDRWSETAQILNTPASPD